MAWETTDGASWTEVTLTGMPERATVFDAASGAQGHLVVVGHDEGTTAYHSSDGRQWTAVLDDASRVAAGDEGFVAVLEPPDGSGRSLAASADGHAWVDGPALGSAIVAVTGIGADGWTTGPSSSSTAARTRGRRTRNSARRCGWVPHSRRIRA